jgi:hypothetical protein
MAFFNDQQLAALAIERMVFHLVGPQESDLVRLEAVEPGRFAQFFLDRIRSVNAGAPYVFSDASETRKSLGRIDLDGDLFQEESERLAEDFQRKHVGTAATGAFLVFVLKVGADRAFALLKYDDETVLTYEMSEGAGGRKRVSLDAVERTFVQNREALQKSALVRLTDSGGELTVLDRRNQQKVARYFESFLDAVRVREDAELTEKLVEVTREVLKANKDLVQPEVYREMNKRTFDAASAGGHLAVDDQKSFLEVVVGRKLPDSDPLVARYQSALRKARIDGVPVALDAAKVRPPNVVRYVTASGIQIRVPKAVEKFIEIQDERIIINDRLQDQYDDTDPAG